MTKQEWEALNAIGIALAYIASSGIFGDAERKAAGKASDAIEAARPNDR